MTQEGLKIIHSMHKIMESHKLRGGVVSENDGAIFLGMQGGMARDSPDKKYNLLHCLHITEDRTVCKIRGGPIHELVAMQHESIARSVAELST